MYKGIIAEIPVGRDGFSGNTNMSDVLPSQLIEANGITYESGVISKEGGSSKLNSTAITGNPSVLGGNDWWPTTALQRSIIYCDDGKMYRDTGTWAFATTLVTGLNTSALPVFVDGGMEESGNDKKLFMFNGVNLPQVITADGTVTTNIGAAGIPAPGACVAALAGAGAGNVDNGTHSYKITFINSFGTTVGGTVSNVVTVTDKTTNGKVSLTGIPVSSSAGVTSRKIYRTVAGDTGNYKEVDSIADNTTTTYTDNTADADLGGAVATTSTANSRPADWSGSAQPKFGFIHEGRLWAGGNNQHTIYFSTTTDHENFVDSGSGQFNLVPDIGEYLIGGLSFKGFAIVFKYSKGVIAIDTTDVSLSNWKPKKINISTGGSSPLGMVEIDDDVLFLDSNSNFQLLSTVQEFGDMASKNFGQTAFMSDWMRSNIDLSKLNKCQAVWYPKKRQAFFAMTKSGSTDNNIKVVIDFSRMGSDTQYAHRFALSDQNTCVSLWTRLNSSNTIDVVSGDDNGFIWKLDEAAKTKAGTEYESVMQTPHDDFRWKDPVLQAKRKNGQFLELVSIPKGVWNIQADIFWDGQYECTKEFFMGSPGVGLGSFILGTSALGGSKIYNEIKRITGSGKRFSVKIRGMKDFAISKFLLYFTLSDERIR